LLKPFGTESGKPKISLFVSGAPAAQALEAAAALTQSMDVAVINVACLKPMKLEDYRPFFTNVQAVVTVEDHSVIGGLGSAISELMTDSNHGVRVLRLGVQDTFGESGEPDELYEKHGLSATKIAQSIRQLF
jgi:transketolase